MLCADVTYFNRNSTEGHYDYTLDWKLQQPNGVVSLGEPNGQIYSGQLLVGASTSGKVCFNDTGQHGQFVLIWHPLVNLRADRGVWLLALT